MSDHSAWVKALWLLGALCAVALFCVAAPAQNPEAAGDDSTAASDTERPPESADDQPQPQEEEEEEDESWQVAPDGVRYADRRSYEVMQNKPLSGNLLKNPSFEKGRYWPRHWDPVDRLGTLWVKGGSHGKRCVRLDTNLQDEQWVRCNTEVIVGMRELAETTPGGAQSLKENPLPEPPEREPTSAPYYSTVGGLHGIHYRSDYIRLKPGAIYRLSVDSRCDGMAPGKSGSVGRKVFVKGFIDRKMTSQSGEVVSLKRNAGRARMDLKDSGEQWARSAFEFHPARWKSAWKGKPVRVEWLQVQLYAYWPPGNSYFDNLRLEIVGHEEVEPPPQKRQEPDADKPKPQLGEDEFPVFE